MFALKVPYINNIDKLKDCYLFFRVLYPNIKYSLLFDCVSGLHILGSSSYYMTNCNLHTTANLTQAYTKCEIVVVFILIIDLD